MKVKVLHSFANVSGNFQGNKVYDVAEAEAKKLIESGLAELHKAETTVEDLVSKVIEKLVELGVIKGKKADEAVEPVKKEMKKPSAPETK